MDAVSELLADVWGRGAVFRPTVLRPPWALRMSTGAPLMLATMLRGQAWVVANGRDPVRIAEGDIAVVRGDVPHAVADTPSSARSSAPTWTVTAADYCPGGTGPTRSCGRTMDDTPDDGPVLLSGAFERRGGLSGRLLHALPAVLVTTAEGSAVPSAAAMAEEVTRTRPGQTLVMERLLDLILVSVLREWFVDAPGWCRAMDDPLAGSALRLMHDSPAQPWTVAELAARTGVSRAAFARRFTGLVGEPPMTYLTGWRIALAAELLRDTDLTVDAIARRVGYSGAFALSVAFKRVRGSRPSDHRRFR
ncbi:AraC family transcriptional regulator [Actinophytocola xinjiangensis]|uniref:AraC family transcriptional regulator n=1 Tax=Actinophytocola xinjiangensis TaxID=485602 RepID=A0A7Z1B044_9PSEU|nr:AraC family transcriptional regulator [Actinophytocola xinjiangensis]OLF12833.1 AraC family transcriptional regulator [Actinophytocola xinjiangensis]